MTTHDTTVLAKSPYGYWPGDEASGNTLIDLSTSAQNATATATRSGYQGAALASGLGLSSQWNGQNVVLPSGLVGASLTLSFWWQPTALNSINDIFGVGSEARLIRFGDAGVANNRPQMSFSSTLTAPTTVPTLVVGTTYHMVFRYDTTTGENTYFLNGLPQWKTTGPTAGFALAGTVQWLFCGASSGRQARGWTHGLAAWKTALTDQDVLDIFLAGAPPTNAPATPVNARAFGFTSSMVIAWDAPTFNSVGAANMAESWEYRLNGGSAVAVTGATTGSVTVTGLSTSTAYTVEVRAVNRAGNSAWVNLGAITTGTAYFVDLVDRADSTSTPNTPTVGGPYTVVAGTWGVTGNQLYVPSGSSEAMVTFPAGVDIDMSATLTGDHSNGAGIGFRYVDSNNFWLVSHGNTSGSLYRRNAGTYYQMAPTWNYTPGQRVRFEAKGEQIRVWVGGLLVWQGWDGFYSTAGDKGVIRVNSMTGTRVTAIGAALPSAEASQSGQYPSTTATEATPVKGPGWAYRGRDTYDLDVAGVT